MTFRAGESGAILNSAIEVAAVTTIGTGADADVVITDLLFVGAANVVATGSGALPAGLGIVGAWVSNSSLGQITVRFNSTIGFAAAPVNIFIQQLA
jgi:hypothetical protein